MTDHSIDLPYEPTDPVPWMGDALNPTGGVVVLASVAEVGDEKWPAIIFRFTKPDGSGFYPPFILACTDDHLAKLRPILMAAIHDAREAAKATS